MESGQDKRHRKTKGRMWMGMQGDTLRRRGDWDKYLLPREPSKSSPAEAASNNASLVSQLESMTLSERSREGE